MGKLMNLVSDIPNLYCKLMLQNSDGKNDPLLKKIYQLLRNLHKESREKIDKHQFYFIMDLKKELTLLKPSTVLLNFTIFCIYLDNYNSSGVVSQNSSSISKDFFCHEK
jgi:hypothetical protein